MSLTADNHARLLRETFLAHVETHAVLPSTNDHARALLASRRLELPALILADSQTAGRGRGSHTWWTGPGSLALTLVLSPAAHALPPEKHARITLAAALAVVQTVNPLTAGHPLGLKWPNDVYLGGRKLCGILAESIPAGSLILGMGLNTNNRRCDAPEDLRDTAVTLADLLGKPVDHAELLLALCFHLEQLLKELQMDEEQFAARANQACIQHGQTLHLNTGQQIVSGTCRGLAIDGALRLETREGIQHFYSGTLSGSH